MENKERDEERIVFRQGKEVYLRPVIEIDLPKLTVHINDEETNLFLVLVYPLSPGQEREWYDKMQTDKTKITFAIVENGTDELVGTIGMHDINHINGTASIGCALRKKFWEKGYGTEAGKLLIEYAFNTLNLRKLNAGAYAFNKRSLALQKKLGFKEEGLLEKQVYRNGEYHDVVQLALFREDYQAKTSE